MIFHLNLEELAVYIRIGIHNWEKDLKQKVLVSVAVSYTKEKDDSVLDYAVLVAQITAFLEGTEYNFLEEAVEALLTFLKSDKRIGQCTITLSKPSVSFAQRVSVTATAV